MRSCASLIAEKEAVVKNQEFDKAATIRDREEKLRLEKSQLEQEWRDRKAAGRPRPQGNP